MSASVAEYYGQRTNLDIPVIKPIPYAPGVRANIPCPFMNSDCKKVKSGYIPICSVRDGNGTLWINCSELLCSSKKDILLSEHQINILLDVGRHIYGANINKSDICIKREERLSVIEDTKYNADFIMSTSTLL